MSITAALTRSCIIPCLRYRDAPAAIEWLCRDLERHLWNVGAYDPWSATT